MSSFTHNHPEFTIQAATDLLNVSRSFLIDKIESVKIPHHKVGIHYRIHFNALVVYKERLDLATSQALDEMVAISQALGLYD